MTARSISTIRDPQKRERTEKPTRKGMTGYIPKLRTRGMIAPRPKNRNGEYAIPTEILEDKTYSTGDTGSQLTASLEAKPPLCPSSKRIPDNITAEVRIKGKLMRA
jgi:hypothetical protein